MAGRGWGKTRTGAEDIAHYGMANKNSRIAVIGATYSDARDTCIEGESGLLACLPEKLIRDWNRSIGELVLLNGTQYRLYSAEKPDRLRGPQHHRGWADEIGAWKYAEDTWDMYQMGLRLGDNPQSVITSTPRPIKIMRDLVKDPTTVLSTGSTYDNSGNLAKSFLRRILAKYEGTRLGLQELYAKLLDDVPGALWERAIIEAQRIRGVLTEDVAKRCMRIVVAVDPAVTSGEDADETGIVVVGMDAENRGYVFVDASCRESSNTWGNIAVDLFRRFRADRIIGETNNGGDLVEGVIRAIDPNVPFSQVNASRGKFKRAEPISSLYEQGRISHVGMFEHLEDQMCTFTPDNIAKNSPDRADALVWGFTELFEDVIGLGLLGLMKQEAVVGKLARVGGLVKPDQGAKQVACPTCQSTAISRIAGWSRCNQCGESFDGKEPVLNPLTRGNLTKGGARGFLN